MFMNTLQEINPNELNTFKLQIQQWLELDSKISTLEKQIRDMKKMKNKSLEPQITVCEIWKDPEQKHCTMNTWC